MIQKTNLSARLLSIALLFPATGVLAQDISQEAQNAPFETPASIDDWTPGLTIGTDFQTEIVKYGQSMTNGKPAAYLFASPYYGPFYMNFSWFNVDYGQDSSARSTSEYAIGVYKKIGKLGLGASTTYVDVSPDEDTNYWQQDLQIDYDFTDRFSAEYLHTYTNNYSNSDVTYNNAEFGVNLKFDDKWSTKLSVGRSMYSDIFKDYNYHDLSVRYQMSDTYALLLHHSGSGLKNTDCPVAGTCSNRVWLELQIRNYFGK